MLLIRFRLSLGILLICAVLGKHTIQVKYYNRIRFKVISSSI